jgi:hypothetical protein
MKRVLSVTHISHLPDEVVKLLISAMVIPFPFHWLLYYGYCNRADVMATRRTLLYTSRVSYQWRSIVREIVRDTWLSKNWENWGRKLVMMRNNDWLLKQMGDLVYECRLMKGTIDSDALQTLVHCRTIEIKEWTPSADAFACLSSLASLDTLYLTDPPEIYACHVLSGCTNITSIELHSGCFHNCDTPIRDSIVSVLGQLPKLTQLCLTRWACNKIVRPQCLERLRISGGTVVDTFFYHMGTLTRLDVISFRSFFPVLSTLTRLKMLTLGSGIEVAGMDIRHMTNLRYLEFFNKEHHTDAILSLSSLNALYLTSVPRELTQLTSLVMLGCPPSASERAVPLLSSFPRLCYVTNLDPHCDQYKPFPDQPEEVLHNMGLLT